MGRIDPRYYHNLNIKNDSPKLKTKENQVTKQFKEVLKEKNELKFSAHAKKRMEFRKIDLNDNKLQRLKEGIDKLDKKGCKESVIMIDQVAYLVSIKNNTVVTVVDNESIKENIFTNIDSMAII